MNIALLAFRGQRTNFVILQPNFEEYTSTTIEDTIKCYEKRFDEFGSGNLFYFIHLQVYKGQIRCRLGVPQI